MRIETKRLPADPDARAPDGSAVRRLLQLDGGSLAQFQLAPVETSRAVAHRTVEELWYFLEGRGEMWRKLNDEETVVPVASGVCLSIPVGCHFQFRALGEAPLAAVGVTLPPWPGEDEAYPVHGKWTPTTRSEGDDA